MADLTAHIDPIVSAIYEQYEGRYGNEPARTYLGASIIGRECERALWYGFRWAAAEKFDGRKLRLFQSGHLAEPRFVADLRSIGAEVYDVNPATGKQFGFTSLGGHMRGHMDGCATGLPSGGRKWHVLEFKTHSEDSFKELKRHGVRKAKPEHYAQMIWYMGKSGMDRALYMAVNKNTDELYCERIEFDATEFARLEAKAERIIFGAQPPARVSDDPKFYLCGWCPHKQVCHAHRVPSLSCRTCCHATPEREGDGRWSCAKAGPGSSIPVEVQRTGCEQHLPLPFLITYASPIDAGDDWIAFQRNDNGLQFVVTTGTATPPGDLAASRYVYTSREISAAADHKAICDDAIADLRAQFPGAQIVG